MVGGMAGVESWSRERIRKLDVVDGPAFAEDRRTLVEVGKVVVSMNVVRRRLVEVHKSAEMHC
jgi:hypothetical protein